MVLTENEKNYFIRHLLNRARKNYKKEFKSVYAFKISEKELKDLAKEYEEKIN